MAWSEIIKIKSDQLNSDDLIGGSKTITITKVVVSKSDQQRVALFFDGDNGKPYKPCLSMQKIIQAKWGDDEQACVGKSMTLYRDPTVKWAGEEVGGIRITHMSHMKDDERFMLTASRNSKRPYKVEHLKMEQKPKQEQPKPTGSPITPDDWLSWTQKMDDAQTDDAIKAVGAEIAQVSESYDQASRDRLKAYYLDRLTEIKKQGALI